MAPESELLRLRERNRLVPLLPAGCRALGLALELTTRAPEFETDEALRWLANAVRLGFVNRRFFTTRDPFLEPLRSDPRFEALMDRAREQQRAFKV